MFWIVFFIALVGAVLNVLGKRVCFLVWLISNGSWLAKNWMEGDIPQAATYAVFVVVSVIGWFAWSAHGTRKSKGLTITVPEGAVLILPEHPELAIDTIHVTGGTVCHSATLDSKLSAVEFAEKIKRELFGSDELPAGEVPGAEAARP